MRNEFQLFAAIAPFSWLSHCGSSCIVCARSPVEWIRDSQTMRLTMELDDQPGRDPH